MCRVTHALEEGRSAPGSALQKLISSPFSFLFLFAFFLAASGCGGGATSGSTGSTGPTAPTNLVFPQASISATAGTPIQADVPTVMGTVTNWTTNPALPAGLAVSQSSGAIYGTPTAASPPTTYTVTAANSAGSTTATVTITVAAQPVSPPVELIYPQRSISGTVGNAIQTDTPTVTGTVSSYIISPALPAGLVINSLTGAISGTPTVASPQATYTVSASNSGGSTADQISIVIYGSSKAMLELGHGAVIFAVRVNGDRVLSIDDDGHWNLWDYTSGNILVDGDTGAFVAEGAATPGAIDLAGSLAVVASPQTNPASSPTEIVTVYSSTDGSQLFTVSNAAWFSLATDGSYVCTGSTSGLTVWSPSGGIEFTLPGDYSKAKAFALPNQVQVALGPAGASVIETDSVPSGSSSLSSSFSGTFSSWFLDGQRFLTTLANAVWVYSNAGVQQSIMNLPSVAGLTGQGNWVWTGEYGSTSLQIYAIGSTTPVATYPLSSGDNYSLAASGNAIFLTAPQPATTATLIDLSGTSPTATDVALPISASDESAFAYSSASQWVVGNAFGVLLDGASAANTPRYFGYGEAYSIAGSSSNIAIATAIGKILIFDSSGADPLGTTEFVAGEVALSSDGTVLGAFAFDGFANFAPDRTLSIYSLPSLTVSSSFSYSYNTSGTPYLADFSLSGSGQTLGQILESSLPTSFSYSQQVTGVSGSPLIWSNTGSGLPILLSPDGTKIAVANGTPTDEQSTPATNIYANGVLVASVPGFGEGWIDNGHLLAANYTLPGETLIPTFTGSTIYDATGAVVSTLPTSGPPSFITNVAFPSSALVYDPQSNAVYSLTNGAAVWQGPGNGPGAIAAANVVYVFGHQVFIAPY